MAVLSDGQLKAHTMGLANATETSGSHQDWHGSALAADLCAQYGGNMQQCGEKVLCGRAVSLPVLASQRSNKMATVGTNAGGKLIIGILSHAVGNQRQSNCRTHKKRGKKHE
jgi:hypothetical protein